MTREETKQAKRKKPKLIVGRYYESIDGVVFHCDEVFGRNGSSGMRSGRVCMTRETITREVRVLPVEENE